VWHVNWLDEPERKWNAYRELFPGEPYCDGLRSAQYGPTDTDDKRRDRISFRFKNAGSLSTSNQTAANKPILIAEFGCDLHNKHRDGAEWAKRRWTIYFPADGLRLLVLLVERRLQKRQR